MNYLVCFGILLYLNFKLILVCLCVCFGFLDIGSSVVGSIGF